MTRRESGEDAKHLDRVRDGYDLTDAGVDAARAAGVGLVITCDCGTRAHAAIGRLFEPQRSLVILFDLQGLKGEACARVLDINVNQVKVYLHRARRKLRSELERTT